jgi:hypothetical protein
MKRFFAAISRRWRRLLRSAAWGALIVALLVGLPFLFDLMNRGIGWIIGLFPHSNRP